MTPWRMKSVPTRLMVWVLAPAQPLVNTISDVHHCLPQEKAVSRGRQTGFDDQVQDLLLLRGQAADALSYFAPFKYG